MITRLARLARGFSFEALDDALTQMYWYRVLSGGLFVRMQDHWYAVMTMMVLGDGTRVFRRYDEGGGSFHETFNGIQQFEDHS